MLNKGTPAIAIDGLSEVARGPAVAAFAAEYPATAILITSQESGELPFEVWRLPRTIAEHIDGLLTLYLGQQQGKALAKRLRETGLFQYLRSGYDVRLVSELAELMLIATSYQTIVWDSTARPSWRDGRRGTNVWIFCRQPPGSVVPNEDRTKTNGDSNPMTMRQKTCSNNSKQCASDLAAASA
jgi:hypothetical protein